MPDDFSPLLATLREQSIRLRDLIDRSERINAANRAMQQWTLEPWFQSVRIANLRGDTAVLYAANAAALVPLRYRQQALLNFLRENLQLPCHKLEIKIKPFIHSA